MPNRRISAIRYIDILIIWQKYLWVDRKSVITPNSAMMFLEGYDLKNMNTTPSFFGCFENGTLIGVNSGHLCSDNSYRSRGLYVFKEYRGKGIGQELLKVTIDQAAKESASFIWSYPRQTSWTTYKKVGFNLVTEWKQDEIGYNAFCKKEL